MKREEMKAAMPKKTKSKPAHAVPPSEPEAALPAGLRLEWMDPVHLAANTSNWRRHPESQSLALTAALKEVGWAGALLFNERTGHLIDGHLRKEITPGGEKVPVLVGSWTEEQEKIILATLDPIGAMAERDQPALDKLLASISVDDPDLQRMFDELKTASSPALVEDEVPIDRADELQKKWQTAAGQLWEIPSKTAPPRKVAICPNCQHKNRVSS
jgi:hypothetical protein